MNSYPSTILIVHEPNGDEDPDKEFNVKGMVEWDDATFTVKRASGEVLFQAETKLVYKSVDVADLYGAEPQISLSNAEHTFEISVQRKHAQAALLEIRRLVSVAAASDATIAVVIALVASASYAQACPDCETALVVRASVFGEGFWQTLGLIVLPLAVICFIASRLHRIGAPRGRR